jgi:hypothetical protein
LFLGERVLIEQIDREDDVWTGILQSGTTLAPDLKIGDQLAGRRFGKFDVCSGIVCGETLKDLPLRLPKPGTTDLGMFLVRAEDPKVLWPTQPFCSNPSCCHITGYNYSKFTSAIRENQDVVWLLGADSNYLIADCQRCGTSTVIDETSFAGCYRV